MDRASHQFQNDVQLKNAINASDNVADSIRTELNNLDYLRLANTLSGNASASAHLPQVELISESVWGTVSVDQASRALGKTAANEQDERFQMISQLGKMYMEHEHNPWNFNSRPSKNDSTKTSEAGGPPEHKNDIGNLNGFFDRIDLNRDGLATADEVQCFLNGDSSVAVSLKGAPELYWRHTNNNNLA